MVILELFLREKAREGRELPERIVVLDFVWRKCFFFPSVYLNAPILSWWAIGDVVVLVWPWHCYFQARQSLSQAGEATLCSPSCDCGELYVCD